VTGTTVTYDVVNVTAGAMILTAQPYVSGAAIEFDGMRVTIQGEPANGDQFTVESSGYQDVFATLANLATVLENASAGQAERAQLNNGLTDTLGNIDRALEHLITERAGIGAPLREVDDLHSTGEDLGLQYQQTLSNLRDIDYARAISELTRNQTYLEAAQQSFLVVSRLSLFDFL
jgi:flagellar hook-associated protein 3 FlgL